jgi:hypothetical protein
VDFGWLWVPKYNISPFLPYGSSEGEGVDKFSVLLFTFGSSKLKQSLLLIKLRKSVRQGRQKTPPWLISQNHGGACLFCISALPALFPQSWARGAVFTAELTAINAGINFCVVV